MLFRLRVAAYTCVACVLLVTHLLAGACFPGAGGNLSSALFAAPGIAAFVLLSMVIQRATPAGAFKARGGGGERGLSALTAGKRPGPIVKRRDAPGWSGTGSDGVKPDRRRALRMKGLHCLYQASAVMARQQGLVGTLQQVVDLIPPAMQYPGRAHARMTCAGMNFSTAGFVETELRVSSEIKVDGRPVGLLQACYSADCPEAGRAPFLEYEQLLVKALAAEAGAFIEQYQAAESPRLRQQV